MSSLNGKLLVISIFASFVLFLGACGSNDGTSAKASDKDKAKSSKEKKKSEYPPAPKAVMDTELRALDGEDFKIRDYEGKVVLINLWATWCAPCIKEMPHFIELQEKYGDEGLVIVGLNTDEESKIQVQQFVDKQKLNYKIGWATGDIADEFVKISRMPGIPQSLLLNRDGEMTGLFRGGSPDVIKQMVESIEKQVKTPN